MLNNTLKTVIAILYILIEYLPSGECDSFPPQLISIRGLQRRLGCQYPQTLVQLCYHHRPSAQHHYYLASFIRPPCYLVLNYSIP